MTDIREEAFHNEKLEGWTVELEKPCSRCGCDTGEVKKMTSGPNYAKLSCYKCALFVKWVPKPENENKKRRKKIAKLKPHVTYCQCCLRTKNELDGSAQLEEHHVLEVDIWPEHEMDPENIWVVCTRCHRMIHNLRLMVRGSGGTRPAKIAQ